MPELLLELLSEEIPARMQARAADNFKRLVTDGLQTAGLAFSDARAFVTPRRLALVVQGLPEKQPDVNEEKKGPKVGAPEQALQGFMKANGLSDIAEAEVRDTPKGSFHFVVRRIAGRDSAAVLPEILDTALRAMPWPKSMRWGKGDFRWVRPLHGIMAIFSGKALSGAFDLGSGEVLAYTNRSVGHRFLAPGAFAAVSFDDYREKLRQAYVVIDAAERRETILARAREACTQAGLTLKEDQGLLDEVAGLVEWPVVMLGTIDEAFMSLPSEVLVTSLRSHQKYFSTLDAEGELADRFVFVSNMAAEDGGAKIVAGNQRVLGARLADARFFWDQDRKISLAERAPGLEEIVFHADLGTIAEKISRIQSLAVFLSAYVQNADRDRARSAARLCKADLTTGMVGEFPELQGVMGRYYALHDGEHPEVAEAIADHYAPQGPNDRCPSAPVSVVVSLADKIDTLAGFWAIGEKPTGSKDPFALRRAALGVIRLIVENRLRLPLAETFGHALKPYGQAGLSIDTDAIVADLLAFFADRLKVALKDQGVRHDLITAVFALGGEDDLTRILGRVAALRDFVTSEDGANLLVAHGRAANIVRIESGKDKKGYDEAVDAALLAEPEERALFEALQAGRGAADRALATEDFTAAMAAMAELRRPVDEFFDRVTVNAEDPGLRANRLRLLAAMDATLSRVADFSKIEG